MPAMGRLRKWVFSFLAALSSLMFIATIAIWVQSEQDYYDFAMNSRYNFLIESMSDEGRIRFALTIGLVSGDLGPPTPWQRISNAYMRPGIHGDPQNGLVSVRWVSFQRYSQPGYMIGYALVIRLWIVALTTSVLPLIWLQKRIVNRRREMTGFCRNCGYDLRATPDRCPECGTIPLKMGTTST
jgi:hypothetical protein